MLKELAAAMEALLRDESKRTRLGENARLTFESRFSLETLTKNMIVLYRGLLARQSATETRNISRKACPKWRRRDAKIAKVTGLGPSSRANARDLTKISP